MKDANNLKQFLQINNIQSLVHYFNLVKSNTHKEKKYQHFYYQLLNQTQKFDTKKIAERIYIYVNDIKQYPVCKQCHKKVDFLMYKKGYSNYCSIKCALKHLYNDPDFRKRSTQKRFKTNLKKYGKKSANLNPSKTVKNFFLKQKEQFQNIKQIYTKDQVFQLLNSEEYNYKRYIGKGNVRKLKKENLCLYKSILQHTKEFIPKVVHYHFSASLLIAAIYNFNVDKILCKCKTRICFDPYKPQLIENGFCKQCFNIKDLNNIKPGFNIQKYKIKYGDQYLEKWHQACQKRSKKSIETQLKNKKENNIHSSVSKVSIQFFKTLYQKLKDKQNIYTWFLNTQYIVFLTKKDLQMLKQKNIDKHIFYLDFWQNNKVIQFQGSYWHRNTKIEDQLRKRILQENHNMKVLYIDQNQYYKNKQNIIQECLNFLENDNEITK